MFCHEGPRHKVDRIWTIRTDGSGLSKIHTRAINMEIAGHEFFSGDGKTIWYDLQTSESQVFWVAGYHTVTGARVQYYVPRFEWSVHFNVLADGNMFVATAVVQTASRRRKTDSGSTGSVLSNRRRVSSRSYRIRNK